MVDQRRVGIDSDPSIIVIDDEVVADLARRVLQFDSARLAEGDCALNLVAELPHPTLVHRELSCPWALKGTVMRVLNERYADGNVDLLDGIKIFEKRGWTLVLPDPDEPVVHLYAEGASDEVSAELGRTLDHFKVPKREKEEALAAFNAHRAEVSAGSKSTAGR